MATMTVYLIAAEQLRPGFTIVSAHRDTEPDGRLKPGAPFLVSDVREDNTQGQRAIVASTASAAPSSSGSIASPVLYGALTADSRTFYPSERVAVSYSPIHSADLQTLQTAIEVLVRFRYPNVAGAIKSVLDKHNAAPPEGAIPADADWIAEAAEWQAAPPSPFPPVGLKQHHP